MNFDVQTICKDFPILQQQVHGKPLIYFDNAATSQKPTCVIEVLQRYYQQDNSNVHRGVHTLSERATAAYEAVRHQIKEFIHASDEREIVFVRGVTEAINLVAQSYAGSVLQPDDEIIITEMEHHSNIVPWQLICAQKKAQLRVVPMNDAGELQLDVYEKLLNTRTKLVAVGHISNALGTINPIKQMIEMAHKKNIPVLIDGAQAAPHMPIDVQALDCDFYTFSGHKVYGPTGVGVLYGKSALLQTMPPYHGGGEMITQVSFKSGTRYKDIPFKFEAGTPNIADVIGLGAAINYLQSIGFNAITHYEHELLIYVTQKIQHIEGIRIIGTAREKASIVSFIFSDVHAHDIGTILDREGIAIRTGHHCAMPVMEHFHIAATSRVSFAFYNSFEEIDRFVEALKKVREIFVS